MSKAKISEWKFKRDTAFRKQFFMPESFAHPAKMDAQLLIKIVEEYTKPGETILDPMAGMGTTMLACTLGRNCVLVELEPPFCKMMQDNWKEVRMRPQLGYQMGDCQIIQGDARQLEGLLVDKIVTSPPYTQQGEPAYSDSLRAVRAKMGRNPNLPYCSGVKVSGPENISNLPYGVIDKIVASPPYSEARSGGGIAQEGFTKDYQKDKIRGGNIHPVGERTYMPENTGANPGQISQLPYGKIDEIVTSPPFQEPEIKRKGQAKSREGYNYGSKLKMSSEHPDNISRLAESAYGNIDSIVTSPPYEGIEARDRSAEDWWNEERELEKAGGSAKIAKGYQAAAGNIGNLKSDTYLQAMLQVYQQCHQVLKPAGLMVLVTKNFIRNKQVIRLDTDTIKLCEQAGFVYMERHYRKLPAQSFWRINYYKKYPEVEQIKHEDVLVFKK